MSLRSVLAILSLVVLAACTAGEREPLPRDVPPIGDFRLGFNIVVANDITKAPGSREATEEELSGAVRAAMEERLSRYDGDGLYHIGLRIEAYSLGRAGIPLLYSPRSVLLIAMNIWDDATQEKLNSEPVRITAGPLPGSGLYSSRDYQIETLAHDAAKEVEDYLKANEAGWFGLKEDRERVPFVRDPETGRALETPDEDGAETDADAAEAADAAAGALPAN